jgi:hypothetical protein
VKEEKMRTIYMVSILTAILTLGLFATMPLNSQQRIDCKQLDTKSPGFATIAWQWVDNKTILFTVTHDAPASIGGSLGETTTTTYTYSFTEDILVELPSNPLVQANSLESLIQTLRPEVEIATDIFDQPVQRDSISGLTAIEVSPNGSYVVYPVINTSETTYRLASLRAGIEFSLEIPLRNLGSDGLAIDLIDVVWADKVDTFIVQGMSGLTNAYLPSTLNIITDAGIDTRRLTDFEPLRAYEYVQFTVYGLNPSGRYLLVDPISPYPDGNEIPEPNYSMIIDINNADGINLRLDFRGSPPVAWLSDDTFRAHTTLGVIDYSIPTQSYITVLTSQFMETIGRTSFSSDGSYMMGVQSTESNSLGNEQSQNMIVACILP